MMAKRISWKEDGMMQITNIVSESRKCKLTMSPAEYDHTNALVAMALRDADLTEASTAVLSDIKLLLDRMAVETPDLFVGWTEVRIARSVACMAAMPTTYMAKQIAPGGWNMLLEDDVASKVTPEHQRRVTRTFRLSFAHLRRNTIQMLREKLAEAKHDWVRVVDSGYIDGILIPFGLDQILSAPEWPMDLRECAQKALDNGCTAIEFGETCPILPGLTRWDNQYDN